MPPIEKMKMAFDFYAHKYEDKITIHDAFTVMGHLTQYDFLLQRDLKQIFKGLAKSREQKQKVFESPKHSFKSMDKTHDDLSMSKNNSPEREFFVVPKIIQK
jgi:hypothetical protein